MSVTAKTTLAFSVVIALLLILALGPLVTNQKVLAANLCGSGFCDPGVGISYPSPLSHFFGGDVLHHHGFHHWWSGGSGFHSHRGLHHH